MKPRGDLLLFIGLTLTTPAMAQNASVDPACHPAPKEGAAWLDRCKTAANAGDGAAAYIVAAIYWNGDGIPKDRVSFERWMRMADKLGQPQAAFGVANADYMKMVESSLTPERVDRAILQDAITWYRKAVSIDPNARERGLAQQRLDQLTHFQKLLPPSR